MALQKTGIAGLEVPLKRWRKWMDTIARRSGNSIDKQLLDVFSFECRAALHRCYSAVWRLLLPYLQKKYQLSDESFRFHYLWHFDLCMDGGDPGAYFHLFHGHVFGLHPGVGIFVQTQTGTALDAGSDAPDWRWREKIIDA